MPRARVGAVTHGAGVGLCPSGEAVAAALGARIAAFRLMPGPRFGAVTTGQKSGR